MKNIPIGRTGLCLVLVCALRLAAHAQMTEVQKNNLRDLSDQYKKQEIARRLEVETFALRNNLPLEVRDTGGQVIALLDHIDNGQPVYIGPDNVVSQASVSADAVKTGGGLGFNLTGAGQVLGIWEAGGTIRATHQEFNGRVTNIDGTASSDHATHVAGTMIAAGVDPAAQGFPKQPPSGVTTPPATWAKWLPRPPIRRSGYPITPTGPLPAGILIAARW